MKNIYFKSSFISYHTCLFIGLTTSLIATPVFAKETSYASVKITESFSKIMKKDIKNKSSLMKQHEKLLKKRYILSEKVDKNVTMSGGKPVPIGPTARLKKGLTWDILSQMSAEEVKKKIAFLIFRCHMLVQTGAVSLFPPNN